MWVTFLTDHWSLSSRMAKSCILNISILIFRNCTQVTVYLKALLFTPFVYLWLKTIQRSAFIQVKIYAGPLHRTECFRTQCCPIPVLKILWSIHPCSKDPCKNARLTMRCFWLFWFLDFYGSIKPPSYFTCY